MNRSPFLSLLKTLFLGLLLTIFTHHAASTEVFWILPSVPGDWNDGSNWSVGMVPQPTDNSNIDNNGTATISSGSFDVSGISLGSNLSGNLSQSGGLLSSDIFEIGSTSSYVLSGGTLQIDQTLQGQGTFDFSTGVASLIASDNAVVDLSQGSLLTGGDISFDGGVGSTLFLPAGVTPNDIFSSFQTQGDFFNVSGSVLTVPVGFTLDIDSDRPDLIRVEGILRPEGSPSSPVDITFDQGGVEVASGGLFNMFGRSLILRTDSSVTGGELRDVGTLTLGTDVDDDVTFTQSSGITDVNSHLRIGNGILNNSNPRGEFLMNGGTLSVGANLVVGTGGNVPTVFSEGIYRQTAGDTTIGGDLFVADRTGTTGDVELLGGTFSIGDDLLVGSGANSDGELILGGATITVNDAVTIGRSDGSVVAELTQTAGDFTADRITIQPSSRYDLTGGTISIEERFDLKGTLDFGGGDALITVADDAVIEWSTGTLAGSAANTNYTAGVDSESYFPVGFDPNVEFASFSSQGLVHTEGTPLVVPSSFTLDVTSDRPDLIRVVGTLRPEGSPANPQPLTFDKGGVEVTSTGLFNLFGANLILRSDALNDGGEIRNAGTLTIGDQSNATHVFTQTGGITDVNLGVRVGYGETSAKGELQMNGGILSIGQGIQIANLGNFTEGVYRQTAGDVTLGSGLSIAGGTNSTGSAEILAGTLTIGNAITIAAGANSDGTVAIGGGTVSVANDVTIGNGSSGIGQLTQAAGNLSLDQITIQQGSRYDLTGGTLTIHEGFDLNGTLNFGGGNATIDVDDLAVVEWATGSLIGSAANVQYTAGVDSESYFPVGFDPFTQFASFSSQGLVQAGGTAVIIPASYDGDIYILNADNVAISGKLTQVRGGNINAASITIAGGELVGEGVASTPEFVNSGILSIGAGIDTTEFTISGDYEQTGLGTVELDINGLLKGTSFDYLDIGGDATLLGNLLVRLTDGFIPNLGSSFELIRANSILGQFDLVDTQGILAPGLAWEVEYSFQSVNLRIVEAGIPGDYNEDGFVDAADYTVWRDSLGNPPGTLPNDPNSGIIGAAQYDTWVANYEAAIPTSANSSSIPEPCSLLLLLFGFASGIKQSRR